MFQNSVRTPLDSSSVRTIFSNILLQQLFTQGIGSYLHIWWQTVLHDIITSYDVTILLCEKLQVGFGQYFKFSR